MLRKLFEKVWRKNSNFFFFVKSTTFSQQDDIQLRQEEFLLKTTLMKIKPRNL